MAESQHFQENTPQDISIELKARIAELDLTETLRHAKERGFGFVDEPTTPEFNTRLREATLKINAGPGPNNMLLDKDPIFEQVVLNPKIRAIVEAMVGEDALLSQFTLSVRGKGARALPLHADQNWTPAPFPEHNQLVTFCWACDEFTKAAGATMAVPDTHTHRRHPSPQEVKQAQGAIALECPAGSVPFWDGSIWHGNWPRTIEGQRVVLHITFTRSYLRQLENYRHLDSDWFDNRPDELRVMLGRQ
jgi:hypothetical protein